MRRFVLFVAALTPIMLTAGCEDGPAQTYSPAPNGAATVWNGPPQAGGITGDGGVYVNPGTEAFDASFGGQTTEQTCTGPQKKAVWQKYFQEPIMIPGIAAGLDIAGGYNKDGASGWLPNTPFTYDPTKETWVGATVEQAEAILCQGLGDAVFEGVSNTIGWGENAPNYELSAEYVTNSRIITDLLFQYGYVGTANATSVDGSTTFSISMNNVEIVETKNGMMSNVEFDWGTQSFNDNVNAVYDAFRNTYLPSFPADADCIAAGHCIIGNNLSNGGYLFFTPLNLSMFVNNTVAPQPAASIFTLIDLGLNKVLPFGSAGTTMKLDTMGEGPVVYLPGIGGTTTNCRYVLGQTFGVFDSTCVQPFPAGDVQNTIAQNKLFGGVSHGDEAYSFDINGIDPQFTATLAPTAVLADNQTPVATDVAYQITVDQFVLGPLANDYQANDVTQAQDLHGLGMVTLEWANLVQHYMRDNGYLGLVGGAYPEIGNPTCVQTPTTPGCSGIEGIITTAPAALVPAGMRGNALGVAANVVTTNNTGAPLLSGLKPGTWYSYFCHQFGAADGSGYTDCDGYGLPGSYQPVGAGGYYFDQMQFEVQQHFGGLVANIPSPLLASRRFFFEQWILAVIKYLRTAGNPNATLAEIDANPIDPDGLFFDSAGGGFETGTYVDRSTVNSAMQAPTALSITTNLTTSVINNFTFSRYNFRGEKAVYTALSTSSSDLPGAEETFLSNIVGSSVLAKAYGSSECATNESATNTDCVDGNGNVILAPTVIDPNTHAAVPEYAGYDGVFGQSIFAIAAQNEATIPSPITVDASGFELIQSAMVTFPIFLNPYDPTTTQMGSISELLPYVPIGANVGFPVTIDGSRDKFYNTYNFDLTGTTVNGNVDFEYVNDMTPDGGVNTILAIRAFETQNYLGLVFACDAGQPTQNGVPVPGAPDNILAVRMYDNASEILNWIGENPAAATACGIEIKYSVYGNYADYISFLNNGIRFGLNPGFGGSVVTDCTLFDPNIIASLGQ